MFLSDVDIKKAIESGDITISNFDEKRLQPATYDILLGNRFLIFNRHDITYIDPANKKLPTYKEVVIKDDEKFVLHPGVSILGVSLDHFGSDKYLIQLSGKSSLARIGLIVHNTAGIINPGHYLNVALELCNLNSVPIVLRPKMEIGQLLFSPISSLPKQHYEKTGRYSKDNWTAYKDNE